MPPSGETGYVRIASFRSGVIENLRTQVADLTKAGAKSLIIDVRRTAEGPLDNGIAAARLFVKSGTLAIKAGRKGDGKETVEARAGDGAVTLPAQVLISNGTAGAAELFAAALGGNQRAQLVGERTIGRAAVQKLVKLPEGRALWLTHARYYRPGGDPIQPKSMGQARTPGRPDGERLDVVETWMRGAIHGRGLDPDVDVEDADVVDFGAVASEADPILDAAVDRVKKGAVK
jgi:C-terminal peptidase prc